MDYVVKNAKKRYTLAPVYKPDEMDSQGDWATAETIEQAAWDYVKRLQKGSAGLNDLHVNTAFDSALGDVVESYVMPGDISINGRVIKQGTWMLGVIWSPETFKKIEDGQRVGYSMEGKGVRA